MTEANNALDEAKTYFLAVETSTPDEETALRNCILASFRRNRIYQGDPDWYKREALQQSLRDALRGLSSDYRRGSVAECDHEANIERLANDLSTLHSSILNDGRFRIGTAQKALNLYLKYLWCLGQLPMEPPHCPIDNIILGLVAVNASWTQMDDIVEYRRWIERIRAKAGTDSPAVWEVVSYKRGSKPLTLGGAESTGGTHRMTTAQEVFDHAVRPLPTRERLRLASLILRDLAQADVRAVDQSDGQSDQDERDLSQFSLSYANAIYPEDDEIA